MYRGTNDPSFASRYLARNFFVVERIVVAMAGGGKKRGGGRRRGQGGKEGERETEGERKTEAEFYEDSYVTGNSFSCTLSTKK